MTDEQLREIDDRATAATPGEWVAKHIKIALLSGAGEHWIARRGSDELIATVGYDDTAGQKQAALDLEFIAAARQDVPALVAEVRRLAGQVAASTLSPPSPSEG